jgi:hypothetical protein
MGICCEFALDRVKEDWRFWKKDEIFWTFWGESARRKFGKLHYELFRTAMSIGESSNGANGESY